MLPLDASFCPRCGVRVDAVPVIPLVGEGVVEAPSEPPTERPRSARTLVGVVVAVLAVLVGLSVVASGDDGDAEEEAGAATSTTERTTTTRPRPRPTPPTTVTLTTTPASGPPQVIDSEVRLDPAYGMGLVGVVDEALLLVDLATGKTTALTPPTDLRSIRQLVWVDGHLVASGGRQLWRFVPGPADPVWQIVDTGGRYVDWIDSTGIIHLSGSTGVVSARLDATGEVVELGSQTVPGLTGLWGGPSYPGGDGAVVVSSADGIFVVRPDGSARRVATGRLVGASGGAVLRYACDDTMDCELHLGLLEGGSLVSDRPIGVPPTEGVEIWGGGVGPGGSTAWVSAYQAVHGGSPSLWIWSGDEWVGGDSSQMVGDQMIWSSDGRALLGIGHWPSVEVVDIDGVAQTIRIDPGVRQGDMGWLLALVPLDVFSSAP